MCFSEKLDRESNGYLEEHGYVLVGYKVVAQFGKILMPWSPVHGVAFGMARALMDRGAVGGYGRDLRMEMDLSRGPWDVACAIENEVYRLMARAAEDYEHCIFPPRQILEVGEGRHGFHVASTEQHAIQNDSASPFGWEVVRRVKGSDQELTYRPNLPDTKIELEEVLRPKPPGVLVRVLVPEHAVDETNHAHAMMVIPPGEKETKYDIAACDDWHYLNRPREKPVEEQTEAAKL